MVDGDHCPFTQPPSLHEHAKVLYATALQVLEKSSADQELKEAALAVIAVLLANFAALLGGMTWSTQGC